MENDFTISKKQWDFFDDATLKIILERSDKLSSSSLEQLRKSTDRSYTLLGFLLTIFSGLTGYLIACSDLSILLPAIVLWLGNFIALVLMFTKAIWVHPFINQGNQPRFLITQKLVDSYTTNEMYQHMLLVSAIEENQCCYDHNSRILRERARTIAQIMTVIKATFIIVAFISLVVKLLNI